ncbi:MAG: glycine--tRNA ligase subunit beta [Desulfobulbaceae bacterium]|nr:glycine--tRNA ligase subunit beta [Desulfobulbaceae bacterium]
MPHELLFEIGTEEIPAGFLMPALAEMKNIMARKLDELALPHGEITTVGTPRRLTICVADLAAHQPDRDEEVLGPPKKAAYDKDGLPTKAAIGFAKSRNAAVEDIKVVTTDKGEYLMLACHYPGEATTKILATLLPELINELPFPKSMRWGSGRTAFVRPIQWLLALYNGEVIPCRADDIASGNTTRGHRFMAPASFTVSDFKQYQDALRTAHVLVDPEERRQAVRATVTEAAKAAGGEVIADEELIDTVTNLVEKPHGVCGTFEERFLTLPKEVLITSMREHQKYFAIAGPDGGLRPHFIAVNNTAVKDVKLAVDGHQRVLRARLEDAHFFFKEDRQRALADRVDDLDGVIFQAKLGTLKEKTARITKLAGFLAGQLAPELQKQCERAAYLAKADLLTAMVCEFTSLQGVIGRHYANLNNEEPAVAQAIVEHYMPVRAGSELPASAVGAIVGLADRIDTIAGCFGIGQIPSGTADPFGLRRQALGLLHIIEKKGFVVSLTEMTDKAIGLYGDRLTVAGETARANVVEFIKGRFVNDLTGRGISGAAVEAATSVRFDNPADSRARIDALLAISGQESFSMLAGSFKRVKNIIKENSDTAVRAELLAEPAEKGLHAALEAVRATTAPLLAANRYSEALAEILKMKEPVDRFFDDVMVMAEDDNIRRNRLALLTAIAELFLSVGDFSKMYGAA